MLILFCKQYKFLYLAIEYAFFSFFLIKLWKFYYSNQYQREEIKTIAVQMSKYLKNEQLQAKDYEKNLSNDILKMGNNLPPKKRIGSRTKLISYSKYQQKYNGHNKTYEQVKTNQVFFPNIKDSLASGNLNKIKRIASRNCSPAFQQQLMPQTYSDYVQATKKKMKIINNFQLQVLAAKQPNISNAQLYYDHEPPCYKIIIRDQKQQDSQAKYYANPLIQSSLNADNLSKFRLQIQHPLQSIKKQQQKQTLKPKICPKKQFKHSSFMQKKKIQLSPYRRTASPSIVEEVLNNRLFNNISEDYILSNCSSRESYHSNQNKDGRQYSKHSSRIMKNAASPHKQFKSHPYLDRNKALNLQSVLNQEKKKQNDQLSIISHNKQQWNSKLSRLADLGLSNLNNSKNVNSYSLHKVNNHSHNNQKKTIKVGASKKYARNQPSNNHYLLKNGIKQKIQKQTISKSTTVSSHYNSFNKLTEQLIKI